MKCHREILTGIVMLAVLGLLSCATQPDKKTVEMVWPLPPEQPRVKFVGTYSSNLDVEPSGGIAEAMFGEEQVIELRKPYGVAVDGEGSIYVTDIGRVFVFDINHRKLRFIGADAGMGKLRVPIGIAISRSGRVYVTDTGTDRVFVYDKNGSFLSAIGEAGEFEAPSGVALDEKRQRIYVADAKKHNVKAFSLDGKLLMTIGKRGKGPEEFSFPTNLAVDGEGDIFVVDTGNTSIKVFDQSGKFIRGFGQMGDYPGSFVRPKGIGIDAEGHVYVVDSAFQNFQIFTKEGRLLLFVGEGGKGFGQFMMPAGIMIDQEDKIYVADQLNKRVQVFQYLGEKWKGSRATAEK